jgi:hypothetical protein
MKRILIALLAFAFAPLAAAQVCNVSYSVEVESDGYDVGTNVTTLAGVPIADILDNAEKFKRVIDAASKEQDKGGTYTATMDETRVCDGGAPTRAQGLEVRGVTLAGSVRIADVALKQGEQINNRYKQRAKDGKKVGWDHAKAAKVQRDDVGKRKK